jgi:hypothetical protein
MTLMQLWQDTLPLMPEVILALMVCVVVLGDMFVSLAAASRLRVAALVGTLVAAVDVAMG